MPFNKVSYARTYVVEIESDFARLDYHFFAETLAE